MAREKMVMASDIDAIAARYARDGYCFPIEVMRKGQAEAYRAALESAQAAGEQPAKPGSVACAHRAIADQTLVSESA
jgi:ketosteroid isomerase-like protein